MAIDAQTTRFSGYVVSGQLRKRIVEMFGRSKAVAGFRADRRGLQARSPVPANGGSGIVRLRSPQKMIYIAITDIPAHLGV
jgi:hypothetical protein